MPKCENTPVVVQPVVYQQQPFVIFQSRTVTVTRVPVREKYKTIIEVPKNFPDEVPDNDYLQYVFFTVIFMIFISMILFLIFTTTNFLLYFVYFMKELGRGLYYWHIGELND